MFYIRTEKNKYDIDVIIDVSDNEDFVKTSGLDWIQVKTKVRPSEGSYFYNEEIISLDSKNYHLIEEVIFEKEEPSRIERDQNLIEEENNFVEESLEVETETLISESGLPEITPEYKEIVLNSPKPEVSNLLEVVESTQENYDNFLKNLSYIDTSIAAYESGNYTFEDQEIRFNPPIEFPNGSKEEIIILPLEMTIDDQIQHLKNQRKSINDLLNKMRSDLGIVE